MIVEDESVQLTMLSRRLKSTGFAVTGARDGISAISAARKEQPDLILLDLGLPSGDGLVVLMRLQILIKTNTIPIIEVSSREPNGNRDKALQSGAMAYFQKPLDLDALLKTIHETLDPANPEPPAPAAVPPRHPGATGTSGPSTSSTSSVSSEPAVSVPPIDRKTFVN